MNRVVVYFYSGRWVPIKFCSFAKAIKLYRQAQIEGKEIFIFPADFTPDDSYKSIR